jgi:hypothetical protein
VTTSAVTASAKTAALGQSLTFTFIVKAAAPGTGVPSGSVTFEDGPTILGAVTLTVVNGLSTATFTTSTLAVGNHSIIAVYSGGPNYLGNTSGPLSIRVSKPPIHRLISHAQGVQDALRHRVAALI